jgi:cardiolipin synthase
MNDHQWIAVLATVFYLLIQVAVIGRAILRPHREPASRVAWIVVIVALPLIGVIGYVLFLSLIHI